ncbi:hypothetical protein PoB_004698300 [Plakobranchus ocellatus]|uniref:Uncharacterized protein n=1 Tax=Plakobranchus ocellatus TaxID=259542 RepID=A0AAV4BMW9_9GAST|nr:hypothetical protein PoB_004698300 [Plakobranchus ocellatus]
MGQQVPERYPMTPGSGCLVHGGENTAEFLRHLSQKKGRRPSARKSKAKFQYWLLFKDLGEAPGIGERVREPLLSMKTVAQSRHLDLYLVRPLLADITENRGKVSQIMTYIVVAQRLCNVLGQKPL